jgi:hypothetical protein
MKRLNFHKYPSKKQADEAALELESHLLGTLGSVVYSTDNLVIPFLDIVQVPVGDAYDTVTVAETIDGCFVVCITRLLPSAFMVEYRKNGKSELYRKLLLEAGNNDRLADYSTPVSWASIK